jgi:hypothetical protein
MVTACVREELDETRRFMLRDSARHEPVQRGAYLAWWCETDEVETADAFDPEATAEFDPADLGPRSHQVFALLLDISASGARVVVDRVPEDRHPLWFRLDGDPSAEWAEAHIVGSTTTPRGPHIVRLAFRAKCPYQTLREAVCG